MERLCLELTDLKCLLVVEITVRRISLLRLGDPVSHCELLPYLADTFTNADFVR